MTEQGTRTPVEIARLMREYRDCHALTTYHPAASAFADAWAELSDDERKQVEPSGVFPRFDPEFSGPRCIRHAVPCARCEQTTLGHITRMTTLGEVHLSCVTREIPAIF